MLRLRIIEAWIMFNWCYQTHWKADRIMLIDKMPEKIRNMNENDWLILLNTIGAIMIKGGALVVSLLTMPAFFRYFRDQEVLGLWFTILSVLSWILTFDLGIGNGLRNHLVSALASYDRSIIKKYISSAYIAIGIVALASVGASVMIFRFLRWNAIFNISNNIVSNNTLNRVVVIVFSGIMLQFLLKLITSILYAMQKSALNNLLNLISSILIYLYLAVAKSSDVTTNLISMAIVYVLAVNIPLLVATIIVFSKEL